MEIKRGDGESDLVQARIFKKKKKKKKKPTVHKEIFTRGVSGGGSRGRVQGVRTPPPPPPTEMKPSSSYSLLKFVYLTGQ